MLLNQCVIMLFTANSFSENILQNIKTYETTFYKIEYLQENHQQMDSYSIAKLKQCVNKQLHNKFILIFYSSLSDAVIRTFLKSDAA